MTGYDVYRNGSLLTPTPVTGTSYSDTTASPGTSYQYAVGARDGAGNVSPQTTPVPVTTPAGASGPLLVQTAASSTTTVTLPAPTMPGNLLVLSASAFTGASHQSPLSPTERTPGRRSERSSSPVRTPMARCGTRPMPLR